MKCHLFGSRPRAVLRVRGDDSFSFLQGQFTNELQKETGTITYGLWLNQKGKVLADSFIMTLGGDEFLVFSQFSAAEIIHQRLEQYIIADDVVVSDETENFSDLATWGDEISLSALLGSLPAQGRFMMQDGLFVFPARRGGGTCFEVIGPRVVMDGLLGRMRDAGFQLVDLNTVEAYRIKSGMPAIPADIGSGDLPNEGGLESTAISFTKGCYLGQEVMARLKNMGQVRRRLHVVRGIGSPPDPLAPLFQGPTKVGEIRSVATEAGEYFAWAMLSLVNFNPALGLQLAPDSPMGVTLFSHG